MYTVIRFLKRGDEAALRAIGECLNERASGFFTGLDRIGDRFSCSLTTGGDHHLQQESIARFIEQHRGALNLAIGLDVDIQLDVAVWPEDLTGEVVTSFAFDPDLLAVLAESHVELALSIYPRKTA